MTEHKSLDLFESYRAMMQPARSLEWLKEGADQFWRNQDHLLECMEGLSKGWLERRHEGAQEARQAAVAMLSAENPAAAANQYQQWANGAISRTMADASAFQEFMSAAAISTYERLSSPLAKGIPPSASPRAPSVKAVS